MAVDSFMLCSMEVIQVALAGMTKTGVIQMLMIYIGRRYVYITHFTDSVLKLHRCAKYYFKYYEIFLNLRVRILTEKYT